ncbi:hypothetical protein FISHEDRAFT_69764 [Fistulina hepatica ATCC 64428]|uniref:Uncharacterized protein n=1 Tax=Fistulina hepatica ATCC 64428 TaxID=1128425 RepID=A0A0D7AP35_9AGAR|nr:hypothetical protein FISHEDRAFT_69764 [Fistulina hepatica ATCC 64428]
MVDNLYSTSFFLWKLGAFYLTRLRDPAGSSNTSFLAHVRNLLVMTLGNFIFPFFLTVIQIILNMQDTSYVTGSLVRLANLYVNILGVIFATVWASGRAWGKSHSMSNDSMVHSAFSASPGHISDSINDSHGQAWRGTRTSGRSGCHTQTSGRNTVLFANDRAGGMQTEIEAWELGNPSTIRVKINHEVSTDLKRSDPSYHV